MTMLELRRPMGVHHTEYVTDAWDGAAQWAAIPDDAGAAVLRGMTAWVDPEGDPETKAAYKGIHHFYDDGVGPASTKGCSALIGVLNGARGGIDIPDGDRRGVYNHAAAHLRDADMEPPALRMLYRQARELRFSSAWQIADMELREESGGPPHIVGHAAVFDQWSEDLGGYRERLDRGTFTKTLSDGADIRALWNHDPLWVLGRTTSGTLTLAEDKKGLHYDIAAPETNMVHDLVLGPIRRKDVTQSSFAFRAIQQEWKEPKDLHGLYERTIHEAALFDVSPVTFPAYPQTDTQARSILLEAGFEFDALSAALARMQRGITPTHADLDLLTSSVELLRSYIPAEPAAVGHSAPSLAGRPVAHLRRLLALRERELSI